MSGIAFSYVPAINLLIIVVLASLAARIVRLPYTVVLIFAGLLASLLSPLSLPQVSPETFLSLLLPPLIFEAAMKIRLSDLRQEGETILSYAFAGTVLSATLIGVFTHFILHFPLYEAVLLGIIVSPTDPIAVISALRRLAIPKRLTLIIEGESLFNDGVAVVLYSAFVSAAEFGTLLFAQLVQEVVLAVVIGVVVGLLTGYTSYRAIRLSEDRFVHIALSFISMYASYGIAIYLNGSGIIGVATCGIILGSSIRGTIPQRDVGDLDVIWEFLAFLVTSVAFLLIGLDLHLSVLGNYLLPILASALIVVIARAIVVYALSAILRLRGKQIPGGWQNVIVWSGLRGPVSVMLALALSGLAIRDVREITAITFGIVFFSILFQGLSMGFVIKRSGLMRQQDGKPPGPKSAWQMSESSISETSLKGSLHQSR